MNLILISSSSKDWFEVVMATDCEDILESDRNGDLGQEDPVPCHVMVLEKWARKILSQEEAGKPHNALIVYFFILNIDTLNAFQFTRLDKD